MKDLAKFFKAMSDETRLRILHLLTYGELCVCDLMEVLSLPQSTISRHMAYLKNAGLVIDRRNGVWVHYSLAKPKNNIHYLQLKCIKDDFKNFKESEDDFKSLKKFQKHKKCEG
ncbi:MAG: hypothetical protein A3C43_01080 [Candidatus Schekmanbacteria bacterium RIFCSPHIGHO2_02_FULL_38_11]|uniref:HTH arsR-type domain-containing protein n=1 Tax=Candidatus Schekmanbacteria bacterium RIFCSPLOWO2_12_FULL_38_15 TaxID=1817883 RepID=A0A1F7SFW1_9BACT|nr:MAG: hypothetical protein A2043_07420 [Candidatus Schekmanbacteria bacterium GWA2_38_9]OGL49138.1 MAG: hypothetical protein A3H37_04175 [Candidatus Schekmanbacteria bacterium RIFCSPLOWO2_02_FULL_38_14]OGL51608.1 MAG: hypothetical protein A3C43_01080 [Candidatus Schekmanbacteria bacterium RIFCSPHIGHO2_02_FULL_38_11]OGL52114.1 MAG: hypothetical protein A3G31_06760 [Candidatus Schekmanbacteria bacterium RIFCSPLOWO2_12_FULL_38_15]